MLNFQYAPAKADVIKAIRAFQWSNIRSNLLLQLLTIPLVGMTFISLGMMLVAFLQNPAESLTGLLLSVATIVMFAFFIFFTLKVNPRKAADQMEKAGIIGIPITYQVSAEELFCQTEKEESHMEWKTFQKLIETSEQFLLVYRQNKSMFLFIPKHAFATETDINAFREFASSQIPQVKQPFYQRETRKDNLWLVILGGVFLLILLAIVAIPYLQSLQ